MPALRLRHRFTGDVPPSWVSQRVLFWAQAFRELLSFLEALSAPQALPETALLAQAFLGLPSFLEALSEPRALPETPLSAWAFVGLPCFLEALSASRAWPPETLLLAQAFPPASVCWLAAPDAARHGVRLRDEQARVFPRGGRVQCVPVHWLDRAEPRWDALPSLRAVPPRRELVEPAGCGRRAAPLDERRDQPPTAWQRPRSPGVHG